MALTWARALGWRMRRHLLDPPVDGTVADVVERLGAVPAYPEASAELAAAVRRTRARPGDLARAVEEGTVLKVYAFRGATHLMTPGQAGAYLALRASSRMWELPSWRDYYDLAPEDWPAFRETVRDALADGPLTRDELVRAVTRKRRYAHLVDGLTHSSDTLLKPLTWQGDMCFGPPRDGAPTYQRFDRLPGWTGIPPLDEAGPRTVVAYLATYGPTTADQLHYWLGVGLGAGRKAVLRWLGDLGDQVAEVDVEGTDAVVLADDLDDLGSAQASEVVRLLPAQDQWVMGPGTKDPHVVPPAHRAPVSRGAAVVVAGGVVAGTWTARHDRVEVTWFGDAGPPDQRALGGAVDRLASCWDRALELHVRVH